MSKQSGAYWMPFTANRQLKKSPRTLLGESAKLAFKLFLDCWEKGLPIRTMGDTVALSPPLITTRERFDKIMEILSGATKRAA